MKRLNMIIAGLLMLASASAQEVKVEFVTPSIVHVTKGTPTKSLVVTAKPQDVAVTGCGSHPSG